MMRKLKFRSCGNFHESYFEELTVFETDFGRFWVAVGLILLFLVVPFVASSYTLYILTNMAIYAIAVIGLNILIGYTGQISLGHGAFFGVGAYTAAIMATRFQVPFLCAVVMGGIVTSGVGLIFGLPSSRLKGLYLAIATLAGQFIIEYVLIHWEEVTMGTMGINLPRASIFGFDVSDDKKFYFVAFVFLLLFLWMAVNIMRTRYGRAFVAIRDNDRAAEGMGIPVFPYKLLSFALSSFYAGVAGALWAYFTMTITTEPFNLGLSVEFIAMVIIGGMGNMSGAIFGTVFISLLNEGLRFMADILINARIFEQVSLTMAPLKEFVFGLAIVLFILIEPRGLAEVWRIVRSNFRLWPFSY
ncbi:MAG TPA: branched-chain amino acid ABC transporter permease [Syntrophales bacterium]|nr:branched-chain amino acid ABC transporter permease [Syntrophales bacterium]HOL58515.1 branched-chain amino acid ABC transporter permease [Syntrophales bacterium]HPO34877.1 branched-chain amino acid ABC transporter permease [Syntrophales bacterium]